MPQTLVSEGSSLAAGDTAGGRGVARGRCSSCSVGRTRSVGEAAETDCCTGRTGAGSLGGRTRGDNSEDLS